MTVQAYRVTVEKLDEYGEPMGCSKVGCPSHGDALKVETFEVSTLDSPQKLREEAKQATCRAIDAMRRAEREAGY